MFADSLVSSSFNSSFTRVMAYKNNFIFFHSFLCQHTNRRRLVNAVGKLSIVTLFKSIPRVGLNNELRSGAFSLLSPNNDSSNC